MSSFRSSLFRTLSFLPFIILPLTAQTATAPSSGDGSPGDPYQIATLNNLYWITQNNTEWNKHFVQTASIDASSSAGWASGAGFSPIGNNGNSFTGSYNGQHNTISGLTIARSSTDYVGMFGMISDATVSNVTLTSVSVSGASYVGGVAGFSTGSGSAQITGCSVSGAVSGTTAHIGGVVGKTQAGTTVSECSSTASVSSTNGNNVGGFVGYHDQSSSISKCYSRGNVSSPNGDHVGGFTGTMGNSATITDCYAAGNASSYNRAGGFAGSKSSGTISKCYSTGSAAIDGGSSVGGFIAVNGGTVSNCFWDIQTSGNASSAAGSGKTTAEMKTASTFTDAGWDLSLIWEMIGSNYPRLQVNQDAALPVELTAFTARTLSGSVELRWNTSTEANNHGFEVQRSAVTAQNVDVDKNAWVTIGVVAGHGSTNAPQTYSFTDASARGTVRYRLKQVDRDGAVSFSAIVEVTASSAPHSAALLEAYPNPFNPATMVRFRTDITAAVSLVVYDIMGRAVAALAEGPLVAGEHSVKFDASSFASGPYLCVLRSGNTILTTRLLLMK